MSAVVISISCIEYRVIFIKKIPAINIIDKPVKIVVYTINWIKRVGPHIWSQIRVSNLDPFIDDADINIRRPCNSRVPSLFCVRTELVRSVGGPTTWRIIPVSSP
jgi:hypothetical protein